MIKISSLTVLILCIRIAVAQIPNSDFESWTDYGSFEDPGQWYTQNILYGGDPELVRSTIESYSGVFAARMENKEDDNGNVIRAIMISGTHALNDAPGFAYNKRPSSLKGFYTFSPKDDDSCSVKVSLWKYNQSTMQRDLIGYGSLNSAEDIEYYTMFSIPVTYVSSLDPDTAVIECYAGRINGYAEGSRLIIDALEFEEVATPVEEIRSETLSVFPNPASEFFMIRAGKYAAKIQLTDTRGVVLQTVVLSNPIDEIRVAVKDLKGLYFVKALSNDSVVLSNQKIFLQ
ncbi:MAG: T9SS type A sorting domain-containing protein [Chitinophagales bacterium]